MSQNPEPLNALGKHIASLLHSGSGVSIPGLGQFGFKEIPFFIPSPSLNLTPCTYDQGILRPHSVPFQSYPPLNLEKFSQSLKMPQDQVKQFLESISVLLKSKQGSEFKYEVPHVGTVFIKSQNVAVKFLNTGKKEMAVTKDGADWLKAKLGIEIRSQSCRPSTAQSHTPSKPVPSSSRNLRYSRPSSAQPDVDRSQVTHSRSLGVFNNQAVNAINSYMPKITLTMQARDQTNRGLLSYQEFFSILTAIDPSLTESQIKKLVSATNCKAGGRIRYKIFLDSLSRSRKLPNGSQFSDLTENYSKANLAPIARLIWEKKLVITEISQSSGMRPRLETQPSELLSVLKKSGIFINIHQLRAILKESENCSVLSLLKTSKILCQDTEGSSVSELARPYSALVTDNTLDKLRTHLAGSNLSHIFSLISKGKDLGVDDFVEFITSQSYGKIKPIEGQQAFYKVSKGEDFLTEPEFCKGFARYESSKSIQDKAFKLLRAWLRQDKLSTEQGFEELLKSSNSSQVLSFDAWVTAMKKFDYNLYEAGVLFDALDTKQDRFIDLSEWMNKVYEDEGPLQSFKDTILKYNIDKQDLLIKLNAHSKQRLTIEDMAEGLRRMDPTLTITNAVNMSRVAAGSKGYIDVQDFLAQLSQEPEEFQGNWKEQILRKIQNKVKGNLNQLRGILEDADHKNTGVLDMVKFQECIFKANLGLDSAEMERLGRVLDRKNKLAVDYNEFLDHLEGPNIPPQDPLKSVTGRLQVFLYQNELTAGQLLKKLGGNVDVLRFARFLKKKVQKQFDEVLLEEIAERFDVNKDGVIDINDLKAILESKNYLELASGSTFPTKALSLEKARVVLKDIRSALVNQKISFSDAFRVFDSKNLGVLTAKQFSDGLSKYIELSEPVKNGLFALIDKLGTGLITIQGFLAVLKDSNLEPKPSKDSWTWENDTIDRIRQWIHSEGISVENAFRAFDGDFDGIISKEDLRNSLVKVLKFVPRDCDSNKIDRLYKLMDHFKRNSIQLSDFKVLFEEGENPNWLLSARQQIGLFISKTYPSIKLAFESVSELTGKIKLEQFGNWVERNQILSGFNLTQELQEKLFANLDPHRKAYMTENDFCTAFGGINYRSQCIQEIKDAIRSNFLDTQTAFDYFLSFKPGSTQLTFSDFSQGISSLIPKRFSQSDLNYFWTNLWGLASIDFSIFAKEFVDIKFMSQFSRQSKKSSNHSTPMSFLSSVGSTRSNDPLKRLQILIKASPNSLETVFNEIDTDQSGKLSAVEFRKALRKLGVGLSARDIDLVMSRIDANNDGLIDWAEFSNSFKVTEMDKVTQNVTKKTVQRMRQNMNSYMLSPKDAFLQFDPDRTGFLDFNRFSNLVTRLSTLANEPVFAFTVIKDLYDLIDIRKDGLIDLREWLNTFKGEQSAFEDSKEFSDLSSLIARNRKVLGITFEAMAKGGKVQLQKAKDVLMTVTRGRTIEDAVWDRVLGVAIREGELDYKFFLEIYKDRALHKQWHPRQVKT